MHIIYCCWEKASHVPYRARKNGEVYYQIKCLEGCENSKRNIHERHIIDEACRIIEKIHFTDEELREIEAGMKSGLRRAADMRNASLEDLYRRKKKVCEDLDYLRDNKITLLREGTMTAAELRKSTDELTLKLQQIDAEHQACTETEEEMVDYVLKFSELMKKAPALFKQATDVERRKMVHLVFTELVLVDGKVESYTPTEGMEWFLRRPVLNGGLDHRNLEHLIRTLMRSPQVIEQSRRFSAMRYKKDPIHATLFSDAIAY